MRTTYSTIRTLPTRYRIPATETSERSGRPWFPRPARTVRSSDLRYLDGYCKCTPGLPSSRVAPGTFRRSRKRPPFSFWMALVVELWEGLQGWKGLLGLISDQEVIAAGWIVLCVPTRLVPPWALR